MKNGQPVFGTFTAAVILTRDKKSKISVVEMRSYKCNECNPLARDCLFRRNRQKKKQKQKQKTNKIPDSKSETCVVSDVMKWPCGVILFGKWVQEQDTVAIFASFQSVNAALSVISMQVYGVRYSALVDTGCFRSIITANRCRDRSRRHVESRTIDGMSHVCWGVGVVSICTVEGNSAEFNWLEVHKKPTGYDLLIGIDVIRALGSIEITSTVEVQLGRKYESCAAITIEEVDFCATFDLRKKASTARWKWTRNYHLVICITPSRE